jgi:1-acyl-sn-glycerol-3-phosphate acyltransferase
MFQRLRQKRPATSLPHLLFYEFIRRSARVVLWLLYRTRAYGLLRLPDTGAVLLVANHQSYLDPPAIGSSVSRRHLEFVARLGLFQASSLFGRLIHALNSIPIKEEGGDAAAIKEILRRLEKGYAVLIFPEGSRSETGAMEPFKRGVAVLVKRAKCPVIPVAVEGCFDAWPRDRTWPRLLGQRVAVAFGDPIPHETLMAEGMDSALVHLAREVERMRLALRRKLRRESHGRFPAPGAGDRPAPISAAG